MNITRASCCVETNTTSKHSHESTAGTISWIIDELAIHQDIQRNLRQEIAAKMTVGDLNSENKIDDLLLLNAVCNEAFRLRPTIPLTLRKSIRDTSIGGEKIPAGTYVAIVAEAINKSPEFWGETALDFNPSRWITETTDGPIKNLLGGSPSPYCMETFLHGPRGCLGKSLAVAEIKRVIATIILQFSFEAIESKIPDASGFITVKPKPGFKIRIRPLSLDHDSTKRI